MTNATDLGTLNSMLGSATTNEAQLCNVMGSQATRHWYRAAAALPGADMDYVEVDLWDAQGAFKNGTVAAGTFTVDTDPTNCGVCVRAIYHKGQTDAKEYFASAGSVTVNSVGAANSTLSVSISGITFGEVSVAAGTRTVVASGCKGQLASAKIDGTIAQIGGNGGGGGGGGGGGMQCNGDVAAP